MQQRLLPIELEAKISPIQHSQPWLGKYEEQAREDNDWPITLVNTVVKNSTW